jgi:hypothetical protein
MSVVRGRPPGLAGGIRGASSAYCSSLRACPAPKSPTHARLSAVHMAGLQEGLSPSRTADLAPLCPRLPEPPRLLKRPLRAVEAKPLTYKEISNGSENQLNAPVH